MANRAFGIPIEEDIHKQLAARKAVLQDNQKLTNYNLLLHNRGAFVRVVSSVNTPEIIGDLDSDFTSNLASNYVLQGGVLKKNEDENGNITFSNRQGLKLLGDFLNKDNVSSYTYDSNSGYRPMVGINALTVQDQGSFGTTKRAVIDFTVWSVDQFDAIEQLYFRPGFNVLIEYGNAAYIDSETLEVNTYDSPIAEMYIKDTKNLREIQNEIDQLQAETSYNYQGLVGRITNFAWSYNQDGGFDCSITVHARGELVESLEVLMPDNKDSGLDKYIGDTTAKAGNFTFLKALKICKKSGDNKEFLKEYLKDRDKQPVDEKDYWTITSNGFNIEGLEEVSEDSQYIPGKGYKNVFHYINLGCFLSLVNNFLIPENKKGEYETFFRINRYEKEGSSKFVTFPGHIALNPGISMLKLKTDTGGYLTDSELYGPTIPNEVTFTEGEADNIYSILLNVEHLIDIVQGFADSKADDSETKTNVFTLIKKVLTELNTNMGGVNQLDLDLDKRVNEWRVVDRNYYDPETTSGNKFTKLDLIGLGSLVTNLKLDSKISNDMVNALSIAASIGNGKSAIGGIESYNKGTVDRFKKEAKTGPAEEITVEDSEASDAAKTKSEKDNEEAINYGYKITEVYSIYTNTKRWDRDAFRNIASDHQQFTSRQYKYYTRNKRQKKEKMPHKGIIPLNLSFTMDGISGLKVGEAFTIQENILPTRYHGLVGFIIKGISDNIGLENRWQTEINTTMFSLPSTEEPDPAFLAAQEKIAKQKKKRATEAKKLLDATKRQQAVVSRYGQPGDRGNFATIDVEATGMPLTYDGKPQKLIKGVHRDVAQNLINAFKQIVARYGEARIKELKMNLYSGLYNKRVKRGGTTYSMHSWGIAIDLYYGKNKLRTPAPEAAFSQAEYKDMVDIFESNGWFSLGRAMNYDYMHFQAWDPGLSEKTGAASSSSRLAGRPYGAK